jgi:tRNA(Ile)-lysidine synthase
MPDAHAIRLIPQETPSAVLVGVSGGLDSITLLHLLARDPDIRRQDMRALHVHHGLHAEADDWAAHCARVCADLGIAFDVIHVSVDRSTGLGPEASARQARRQAFAQALRVGETLALAQHRDDQAETFLLRALRASGPDGLAAMHPWQPFAAGWMWRPLLNTARTKLLAFAERHALSWIEDPSNADTALDRNFLRQRVMPLLRERWPHADAAFARAAALAAESSDILAEDDALALAAVREEIGAALSAPALLGLSAAKRARLLRHWVATLGWPPLPGEGIARIEADLLGMGSKAPPPDRMPSFAWHGVEIRRWREGLYALGSVRALPADWSTLWDGSALLALPNGDTLQLQGADRFPSPLQAHARRGGEKILLPDRGGHHHTLKHVLQEQDVPPWERERMPLLSTEDGILLAAGDAIRSAGFDHWMQSQRAQLVWSRT